MSSHRLSLFFSLGFGLICLFRIQSPESYVFDETHYIKAAKEFVALGKNTNWEHPTLGKILIALGMFFLGDNPLGWRIMSVIAGTFLMFFSMQTVYVITNKIKTAVFAGLLVAASGLVFVHARIALLEIFLWTFLMASIFFYVSNPLGDLKKLCIVGALAGAATAVKWSGAYLVVVYICFESIKFLFYTPQKRSFLGLLKNTLTLGLSSVFVYFVAQSFLMLLKADHYSFWDVFTWQKNMWLGQIDVGAKTHGYQSPWYTWPLMLRPIWYHYQSLADLNYEAVFPVGNPLIFWTLPLAMFWSVYSLLRKTGATKINSTVQLNMLFLNFCFWGLYLIWAAAPRSLTFFYYYGPSAIVGILILSYLLGEVKKSKLAWAYVCGALLLFVYFYPVYSAWPINSQFLPYWTWFSSWI